MLYSCTRMATAGVRGLTEEQKKFVKTAHYLYNTSMTAIHQHIIKWQLELETHFVDDG